MLYAQVQLLTAAAAVRTRLVRLAGELRRDERGEVTSTTITIAILATLALAVGAIVVAKVTEKANSIPTE